MFLSYLWGMETIIICYCIDYFREVLILPMRNGNDITYINVISSCYLVLILPMRNGNILHQTVFVTLYQQVLILPMRNGNFCFCSLTFPFSSFLSYLWGMETSNILVQSYRLFCRSYPTYEEWKLSYKKIILLIVSKVLILPMRNGNFFDI